MNLKLEIKLNSIRLETSVVSSAANGGASSTDELVNNSSVPGISATAALETLKQYCESNSSSISSIQTQTGELGSRLTSAENELDSVGAVASQALQAAQSAQQALPSKADLVGGLIPASQIPAAFDDVLEFATFEDFPAIGERGKVYVALGGSQANQTFRWSGTTYVKIGNDIALGETAQTAYRGDRGKEAYDLRHSHDNKSILDLITAAFTTALKSVYDAAVSWISANGQNILTHLSDTTNPHNVTKAQVGLSNVPNTDATNPANISQSASFRFTTDTEKTLWNQNIRRLIGSVRGLTIAANVGTLNTETELTTITIPAGTNDTTSRLWLEPFFDSTGSGSETRRFRIRIGTSNSNVLTNTLIADYLCATSTSTAAVSDIIKMVMNSAGNTLMVLNTGALSTANQSALGLKNSKVSLAYNPATQPLFITITYTKVTNIANTMTVEDFAVFGTRSS